MAVRSAFRTEHALAHRIAIINTTITGKRSKTQPAPLTKQPGVRRLIAGPGNVPIQFPISSPNQIHTSGNTRYPAVINRSPSLDWMDSAPGANNIMLKYPAATTSEKKREIPKFVSHVSNALISSRPIALLVNEFTSFAKPSTSRFTRHSIATPAVFESLGSSAPRRISTRARRRTRHMRPHEDQSGKEPDSAPET